MWCERVCGVRGCVCKCVCEGVFVCEGVHVCVSECVYVCGFPAGFTEMLPGIKDWGLWYEEAAAMTGNVLHLIGINTQTARKQQNQQQNSSKGNSQSNNNSKRNSKITRKPTTKDR